MTKTEQLTKKNKMTRYTVEYKGKKYISIADNAIAAFEKFANRKVFGEMLIWSYKLEMYDATTRGKKWAKFSYACRGFERKNAFVTVAI